MDSRSSARVEQPCRHKSLDQKEASAALHPLLSQYIDILELRFKFPHFSDIFIVLKPIVLGKADILQL